MIEETDPSVKENVKSNKFLTKKIQEIWDTMKRQKNPTQRHGKHIQQNHRRKLSQPKEGHTYKGTRRFQNTKQARKENVPSPHNNQKLNMQNKDRILRTTKEKGQVTYKGRTIRITPTSPWRL